MVHENVHIHVCACVHTLYAHFHVEVRNQCWTFCDLFCTCPIYLCIDLFVCLFDSQSVSEPQDKQFLKLVDQQTESFCL